MQPTPIDPHWADLDALVSRAERNRAELARLHAERAELCAAAIDLVEDRVAQRAAARGPMRGAIGDDIPLREVIAELGAALRVGDQTVRHWLGDGTALVTRYPTTLAALREGRIDDRHASAIIDGGASLTDADVRAEYERVVLDIAEHETASRLRDIARVIAARLQPDTDDERQREGHKARRIRLVALDESLTRLLADIPATLAHAIFARLTDMARAVDMGGIHDIADAALGGDVESEADRSDECRTLGQRRADVFCDLLLTGSPTGHGSGLDAIRGTVQVTVPVLTLAGLGDEPAILVGHGPIDAETARRLAAGAPGWDRILTHPHTGEPLACDRYRPTSEMRRFLAARDEHCRWPGCRRAASRCDADHTVAYADGGQTTASNLSLFCRRHHRLKHASPWRIRHLGRGTLEFTSPTGRTHRGDAPPVTRHVRRNDPWLTPPDPRDPAPF